jgi:hypothetical protein
MKPEDTNKKVPERVEHLDEEVPPEANIRGKVWEENMHTICRG